MTDTIDRAAIVRIRPEVLAELLQFPEGACIDAVQSRIDEIGSIELRIRGAGWPVEVGRLINHVQPMIRREHDATSAVTRRVIEWKFAE